MECKATGGSRFQRTVWSKDSPEGSNCGNAAVVKRVGHFMRGNGEKEDKAIVSLFSGAQRVKKIKRE